MSEWVSEWSSSIAFLGTADTRVYVVHTSCVIIAYTLESLFSLTLITHNLQATIKKKKDIKKETQKVRAPIQLTRIIGRTMLYLMSEGFHLYTLCYCESFCNKLSVLQSWQYLSNLLKKLNVSTTRLSKSYQKRYQQLDCQNILSRFIMLTTRAIKEPRIRAPFY